MSRFGHGPPLTVKNAFGLTFPEKRAVELRRADKRAWLVTNIDEVGSDHRDGKRDCDCCRPRQSIPLDGLDQNAAGIGFCIDASSSCSSSCRETRAGHGNRQNANEKRHETATMAIANRRIRRAPFFASSVHSHHFCGASACIRADRLQLRLSFRCAFALLAFANATSDSLIH